MAHTYNDYPESASNNAKKAIKWKKEHGSEVKGGTAVGWKRAHQLANRENLSAETIARMASFARHEKNSEVDPKYKNEPWKDRGNLAYHLWGGASGINWAKKKIESIRKAQNESLKIDEAVISYGNDSEFAKVGYAIKNMSDKIKSNVPMFNHAVKKIDQFLRVYFNEFGKSFYHRFNIKDANGNAADIDNMDDRAGLIVDITPVLNSKESIEVMILTDPNDTSYDYYMIVGKKMYREVDDFNDFADAIDDALALQEYIEYLDLKLQDLDENVASVSMSSTSSPGLSVSQPSSTPGQPGTPGTFFGYYPWTGKSHVWVPKKEGKKKRILPTGWAEPMLWSEFKKKGEDFTKQKDVTIYEDNELMERGENKVSFQISDNLKKVSRIQKLLIDASQAMTEMTDEIKRLKQSSEKIEQPMDDLMSKIEKALDDCIYKIREEETDGKSTNLQALMRKVNNYLEDMKEKILG